MKTNEEIFTIVDLCTSDRRWEVELESVGSHCLLSDSNILHWPANEKGMEKRINICFTGRVILFDVISKDMADLHLREDMARSRAEWKAAIEPQEV